MSQPQPRHGASPWVWVGIGALVVALVAVWGTIALRDLGGGGQATDTPTTATTEPSTPTPSETDESGDRVITLAEPSGASADTAAIWMSEPPAGFTLVDIDEPYTRFEGAPGCVVTLGHEEGIRDSAGAASDAEATEARIAQIIDTMTEINNDLQTLAQPDTFLLPVNEDGSGGDIEFARFGVEYIVAADGAPQQTSIILRVFHDIEMTIQLVYTCKTADADASFDEILEGGLWFQP